MSPIQPPTFLWLHINLLTAAAETKDDPENVPVDPPTGSEELSSADSASQRDTPTSCTAVMEFRAC